MKYPAKLSQIFPDSLEGGTFLQFWNRVPACSGGRTAVSVYLVSCLESIFVWTDWTGSPPYANQFILNLLASVTWCGLERHFISVLSRCCLTVGCAWKASNCILFFQFTQHVSGVVNRHRRLHPSKSRLSYWMGWTGYGTLFWPVFLSFRFGIQGLLAWVMWFQERSYDMPVCWYMWAMDKMLSSWVTVFSGFTVQEQLNTFICVELLVRWMACLNHTTTLMARKIVGDALLN